MKCRINKTWWAEHKIDMYYSLCIIVAGTLLHFAYEWSGNNAFVALFSAVNESVWEHLKLFFIPAFFFTLFMYYLIGERCPNYLWCQTKSILAGMLWILIAYYTISGITKREIMWVDIGIFYISAVLAGIIGGSCRTRGKERETSKSKGRYAGLVLLIIWALFIGLTYYQPDVLVEWFPGLFGE